MSVINELTSKVATQTVSKKVSESNSNKNFYSVIIDALQSSNGKRPAHLCCCENSVIAAADSSNTNEEKAIASVANTAIQSQASEAKSSEVMSAGSCFAFFIRVSARVTTEVGEALSGKFRNTTLAFAESLKSDKTYNENLLKAFMEKTDEKLNTQKTELSSYINSFFDEIMQSLRSSFNGLNSVLLSSSNLLGSSLGSYSNLLGNPNLLGSNSASLSLMSNLSSSSSLVGYSALDVANAKIMSLNNADSISNYIGGISLKINRYAGRNLKIVKTSEIQQTASVSNENAAALSSDNESASVENNQVAAEVFDGGKTESELNKAMESRNNMLDLFKNMILSGLTNVNTNGNINLDKIKAEINLSLV